MKYEFGFIGCGNMGGALVRALSKTECSIAVCDHNESKVKALCSLTNVKQASASEIAKDSRFVVLGTKPQVIEIAIAEIKEILQNRKDVAVISMAAGVTVGLIKELVGADIPTIRIMPSTPSGVGEGVILYSCNVDKSIENAFVSAFNSAGMVAKIDESRMDDFTAITGCGPAFVYMFIDAMTKSAIECGIDERQAERFVAQTVLGSAKMVLENGDADALKVAVCSPGGSTIEGVKSLEKDDIYSVVSRAVQASRKRTREMRK